MKREGQKEWVRDVTFLLGEELVVDPAQFRGREGLKHLTGEAQDTLDSQTKQLQLAMEFSNMTTQEAGEWLRQLDKLSDVEGR